MSSKPMDLAMRLLKAPYNVYSHEGYKKEPFEGTLYAGGDVTDTPKYYTPSLEGALDYAVYGSATGDVPMRDTTPAIRTVQDPGFNEKGQPAGSLIADPQLQDAYMQDDDSPLQSELMDDDTLRQLILQMSDKSPKSDTTGYYHSQQDRKKHIQGALERLKNKTSGRLDLTDSQKEMGGISTGRHDELDVMDFDDINSGWDFLEDWEKSWLLNNRFDELPMWLQEEHQDEVKTGEPMDIAMRLLKKLPPHWSRDFDTIEELRDPKHGIQSMRAMSLEDARNIEQIPLRSGNIEFERDLTDPDITGAKSIVPGIAGGNIYDESLVREGGGFVYRPHLAALAPLSQYTDMPSSPRPNVLVASTEKPEFRASKNEGRLQTEGFMPVGMDPNQAYLLSDPTKPFTREDLLQQARIKQAGGVPYHARSDIEIHPLDGYATASRALETLPNQYIENPMTEMGTWGQPRVVAGPQDSDVFYLSEPMDLAMRLLKERVSPEAKRHKLEYDKKYESSPERVKYREELNRERRRRHIMGQGGPDMSHTSQHTIVPEDPHTNRARHFKDKGTLL